MAKLNHLSIIGHLGKDPELRYTPAGKAVCEVRVAVNNSKKDANGEWIDRTLWVAVETWEAAAERAAEQLHKGDLVYAEGQLDIREYTDRDGKDRYSVELRFARVQSLERRARDESNGNGYDGPTTTRQPAPVAAATPAMDVDDIPF